MPKKSKFFLKALKMIIARIIIIESIRKWQCFDYIKKSKHFICLPIIWSSEDYPHKKDKTKNNK